MRLNRATVAAGLAPWAITATCYANIDVTSFGDDCWSSGDTRAGGYLNTNSPPDNQLVLGRLRNDGSGLLEDTLIAERLSFALAPIGAPRGPGSLRLSTPGNGDKATLDRRCWPGLSFSGPLSFEYAWLTVSEGTPTAAAPALKILIDTSDDNPTGDQAEDAHETIGDKILVFEPYFQGVRDDDAWTTEIISPTEGRFWLVNLDETSPAQATDRGDLRTLSEWMLAFDNWGLGVGTTIASLQIGIGSGNPGVTSHVDYLDFNDDNESFSWDFDVLCLADLNDDGLLDNGDIQTFLVFFLGGDLGADLNVDGILDNGDIQLFLTLFLAGC